MDIQRIIFRVLYHSTDCEEAVAQVVLNSN